MKYFQIILIVLNLILGTGAIFYVYQLFNRYKLAYLKYIVFYLVSLNLLVFVDFVYKYILSIFDFDGLYGFSAILFIIPIIILYLAEYGITFYLFCVLAEFKEKAVPRNISYLFIAWVTVFLVATGWGIFDFFVKKSANRFYITHAVWIATMLVIILSMLILHLLYSKNISNPQKRKPMLAFGFIFLAAFLCFTFGQVDYYFFKIMDGYYLDHIFLILLNLAPLVWIYFHFQKPDMMPQLNIPDGQKLEDFIKHHNISAREKEIIELLINGKTNKEIETELFISFNTVKNHIYAIFKKTGVNSRAQLTNLIQRFEENS